MEANRTMGEKAKKKKNSHTHGSTGTSVVMMGSGVYVFIIADDVCTRRCVEREERQFTGRGGSPSDTQKNGDSSNLTLFPQ